LLRHEIREHVAVVRSQFIATVGSLLYDPLIHSLLLSLEPSNLASESSSIDLGELLVVGSSKSFIVGGVVPN
jgi:hypothetical protein